MGLWGSRWPFSVFLKLQCFVKERGERKPVGGCGLFFVINTLQELSGCPALLWSCHVLYPGGMRRPLENPRGESSRWSDVWRCRHSCFRLVMWPQGPGPAALTHSPSASSTTAGCAVEGRALGASASKESFLPVVTLIEDDSFMDNWKLDFWKSNIYLKENLSYLLPPVKYYGNMSANNLLCVICSNANKQQLGYFLW